MLDRRDVIKFPFVSGFDFSSKKGYFLKHPVKRKYDFITADSIPTELLAEHFEGTKTIALPKYAHTKTVSIDIDDRHSSFKLNPEHVVKKVVKYLGEPFYIEYSLESNGYHLYYKFKEYVSDNALRFFRDYLYETYKMKIEPTIGNGVLRLPYSENYKQAGTYNSDCFLNPVEDLHSVVEIFSNAKSSPMPNIFFGKNTWGKKADRSSDGPIFYKNKKDYTYGSGKRIASQIEIAFAVLDSDGGEQDYIRECERFDCGSKDMRLPLNQRDEYILKIFHWAKENYARGTKGNSTFKLLQDPDKDYIHDPTLDFSDEIKEQLKIIFDFYAPLYTSYKNKNLIRFTEDCLTVYTQIHAKQLYDTSRPDKYSDDNLTPLNKGALLPKVVLYKMAKQFQIKNIDKVVSFLLKTGILTILESKDGYAKSYKGKLRWAYHYATNLDRARETSISIKLYLNKNYTYNNISFVSDRRYKLYKDLISSKYLKFMHCNEYIRENRPPPIGLNNIPLRQRLRYIDKKLKTYYIKTNR